jgi:hypothetical protein
MISQKLLEKMSLRDREMIQIFQTVFNEDELNLITRIFGAEKLAIFMKMSTMLAPSGRQAGLGLVAIILSTMKEQGSMSAFFAEANSFKPVITNDKVH